MVDSEVSEVPSSFEVDDGLWAELPLSPTVERVRQGCNGEVEWIAVASADLDTAW
jgi:hypothetical protein